MKRRYSRSFKQESFEFIQKMGEKINRRQIEEKLD